MSIRAADGSASLDNSNEISFTTQQMEKLWTDLSQAWPAVKNNPEIAEKIEKLWDILKASGNDHLAINKEIQNLLDSNNNSSALASTSMPSIEATQDSLHTTTQADQDLDSLLAEILGENYQDELNQPAIQTDNNQNIPDSSSIGSGTEELDKLVASILGDDWLKEDSTTTDSPSLYDSQINKSQQNIDSLVSSIIGDDLNEESSIPSTSKVRPENQKLIDDKQDIDKLLNEILHEDELDEKLTSDSDSQPDNIYRLTPEKPDQDKSALNKQVSKAGFPLNTTSSLNNIANEELTQITDTNQEENIDELINEILHKDKEPVDTTSSLSNISIEEQTQVTDTNQEEDIDELINEIIHKNNESVDTESSLGNISIEEYTQVTDTNQEENIDELINEIIHKDNDSVDTTTSLDNISVEEQSQEENIDELINKILEHKTDTNISVNNKLKEEEEIPVAADKTRTSRITSKITTIPESSKVTTTSYKQDKKESSYTFIIILVLLILSFIGAWKFFFNNKESIQENIIIKEQLTEITPSIEEDSPFSEEIPEEKYTPPTIKKYKTEPEYILSEIEQSTDISESGYSARIERDKDDITIILNTPETAIEADIDSTLYNENEVVDLTKTEALVDNNITTTEKIIKTTPPGETLSKNELVVKDKPVVKKATKEKPVKTKPKRRVIIHRIVKGDTLWAIAKRYVHNPYRYPELARLSKIKNPDRIYPGNKVKIVIFIK